MKNTIIKIISLAVVIIFTTNTIALSAPDMVYRVRVPEEYGKITQRWTNRRAQSARLPKTDGGQAERQAENTDNAMRYAPRLARDESYDAERCRSTPCALQNKDRMVIVLQDAHDNFGAQKNIAQIIRSLIPQFKEEEAVIGIEGAIDKVDVEHLRTFPIAEAREKTSEELMKRGYITGTEHAAISAVGEIPLWGVEDPALFRKDFALFYNISTNQEYIAELCADIEVVFTQLKQCLFNPALKEFDTLCIRFADNSIPVEQYFNAVYTQAKKHGIGLNEFTQIMLFHEIVGLETQIDEAACIKEVYALENALGMTPANQAEKLAYKYLLKLWHRVQKNQDLPAHLYKNVQRKISAYRKLHLLDTTLLLRELLDLSRDVAKELAKTSVENTIIQLSYEFHTLKKALTLRATHDEVQRIRALGTKSSVASLHARLRSLANHYQIEMAQYSHQEKLDQLYDNVEEFYTYAEKRDAAMLQNLLAKMSDDNKRYGILVAGGYHSQGITKRLREQNIPHLVITPQIYDAADTAGYLNRMLGHLAPINSVMTSYIHCSRINALMGTLWKDYEGEVRAVFGDAYTEKVAQEPTWAARLKLLKENVDDNDLRQKIDAIYAFAGNIVHQGIQESVSKDTQDVIVRINDIARQEETVGQLKEIMFAPAKVDTAANMQDFSPDAIPRDVNDIEAFLVRMNLSDVLERYRTFRTHGLLHADWILLMGKIISLARELGSLWKTSAVDIADARTVSEDEKQFIQVLLQPHLFVGEEHLPLLQTVIEWASTKIAQVKYALAVKETEKAFRTFNEEKRAEILAADAVPDSFALIAEYVAVKGHPSMSKGLEIIHNLPSAEKERFISAINKALKLRKKMQVFNRVGLITHESLLSKEEKNTLSKMLEVEHFISEPHRIDTLEQLVAWADKKVEEIQQRLERMRTVQGDDTVDTDEVSEGEETKGPRGNPSSQRDKIIEAIRTHSQPDEEGKVRYATLDTLYEILGATTPAQKESINEQVGALIEEGLIVVYRDSDWNEQFITLADAEDARDQDILLSIDVDEHTSAYVTWDNLLVHVEQGHLTARMLVDEGYLAVYRNKNWEEQLRISTEIFAGIRDNTILTVFVSLNENKYERSVEYISTDDAEELLKDERIVLVRGEKGMNIYYSKDNFRHFSREHPVLGIRDEPDQPLYYILHSAVDEYFKQIITYREQVLLAEVRRQLFKEVENIPDENVEEKKGAEKLFRERVQRIEKARRFAADTLQKVKDEERYIYEHALYRAFVIARRAFGVFRDKDGFVAAIIGALLIEIPVKDMPARKRKRLDKSILQLTSKVLYALKNCHFERYEDDDYHTIKFINMLRKMIDTPEDFVLYVTMMMEKLPKRTLAEMLNFMSELTKEYGLKELADEISDRAFMHFSPARFEDYKQRAEARTKMDEKHRQEHIESIKAKLEAALRKAMDDNSVREHECRVTGRAKRYVAMSLKEEHRGQKVEEMRDLFAFRAIVETVEDVWQVFAYLQSKCKEDPSFLGFYREDRFRDYITKAYIALAQSRDPSDILTKDETLPYYQALHLVVDEIHDDEIIPIEIQIRTYEMDKEAEFGRASHIARKARLRGDKRYTWEEPAPDHGIDLAHSISETKRMLREGYRERAGNQAHLQVDKYIIELAESKLGPTLFDVLCHYRYDVTQILATFAGATITTYDPETYEEVTVEIKLGGAGVEPVNIEYLRMRLPSGTKITFHEPAKIPGTQILEKDTWAHLRATTIRARVIRAMLNEGEAIEDLLQSKVSQWFIEEGKKKLVGKDREGKAKEKPDINIKSFDEKIALQKMTRREYSFRDETWLAELCIAVECEILSTAELMEKLGKPKKLENNTIHSEPKDTANVASLNAYDLQAHKDLREYLREATFIQIFGERIEGVAFNDEYERILRDLIPGLPKDVNIMLVEHNKGSPDSIEQRLLFYDAETNRWIFSHAGTRGDTGKFVYLPKVTFDDLINMDSGRKFLKKLIPDEIHHADQKFAGQWNEDYHKNEDAPLREYVQYYLGFRLYSYPVDIRKAFHLLFQENKEIERVGNVISDIDVILHKIRAVKSRKDTTTDDHYAAIQEIIALLDKAYDALGRPRTITAKINAQTIIESVKARIKSGNFTRVLSELGSGKDGARAQLNKYLHKIFEDRNARDLQLRDAIKIFALKKGKGFEREQIRDEDVERALIERFMQWNEGTAGKAARLYDKILNFYLIWHSLGERSPPPLSVLRRIVPDMKVTALIQTILREDRQFDNRSAYERWKAINTLMTEKKVEKSDERLLRAIALTPRIVWQPRVPIFARRYIAEMMNRGRFGIDIIQSTVPIRIDYRGDHSDEDWFLRTELDKDLLPKQKRYLVPLLSDIAVETQKHYNRMWRDAKGKAQFYAILHSYNYPTNNPLSEYIWDRTKQVYSIQWQDIAGNKQHEDWILLKAALIDEPITLIRDREEEIGSASMPREKNDFTKKYFISPSQQAMWRGSIGGMFGFGFTTGELIHASIRSGSSSSESHGSSQQDESAYVAYITQEGTLVHESPADMRNVQKLTAKDLYYIKRLRKEFVVYVRGKTGMRHSVKPLDYCTFRPSIRRRSPEYIYYYKAPLFKKYGLPVMPKYLDLTPQRIEEILRERMRTRYRKHSEQRKLERKMMRLLRPLGMKEVPSNIAIIPSTLTMLEMPSYFGIPLYERQLSYMRRKQQQLSMPYSNLRGVKFANFLLHILGFDEAERRTILNRDPRALQGNRERLINITRVLLEKDYHGKLIHVNKDDFLDIVFGAQEDGSFIPKLRMILSASPHKKLWEKPKRVLSYLLQAYRDYFKGDISSQEMAAVIRQIKPVTKQIINQVLIDEVLYTGRFVELLNTKPDFFSPFERIKRHGATVAARQRAATDAQNGWIQLKTKIVTKKRRAFVHALGRKIYIPVDKRYPYSDFVLGQNEGKVEYNLVDEKTVLLRLTQNGQVYHEANTPFSWKIERNEEGHVFVNGVRLKHLLFDSFTLKNRYIHIGKIIKELCPALYGLNSEMTYHLFMCKDEDRAVVRNEIKHIINEFVQRCAVEVKRDRALYEEFQTRIQALDEQIKAAETVAEIRAARSELQSMREYKLFETMFIVKHRVSTYREFHKWIYKMIIQSFDPDEPVNYRFFKEDRELGSAAANVATAHTELLQLRQQHLTWNTTGTKEYERILLEKQLRAQEVATLRSRIGLLRRLSIMAKDAPQPHKISEHLRQADSIMNTLDMNEVESLLSADAQLHTTFQKAQQVLQKVRQAALKDKGKRSGTARHPSAPSRTDQTDKEISLSINARQIFAEIIWKLHNAIKKRDATGELIAYDPWPEGRICVHIDFTQQQELDDFSSVKTCVYEHRNGKDTSKITLFQYLPREIIDWAHSQDIAVLRFEGIQFPSANGVKNFANTLIDYLLKNGVITTSTFYFDQKRIECTVHRTAAGKHITARQLKRKTPAVEKTSQDTTEEIPLEEALEELQDWFDGEKYTGNTQQLPQFRGALHNEYRENNISKFLRKLTENVGNIRNGSEEPRYRALITKHGKLIFEPIATSDDHRDKKIIPAEAFFGFAFKAGTGLTIVPLIIITYFIARHYREEILSWSLWDKAPPIMQKMIARIFYLQFPSPASLKNTLTRLSKAVHDFFKVFLQKTHVPLSELSSEQLIQMAEQAMPSSIMQVTYDWGHFNEVVHELKQRAGVQVLVITGPRMRQRGLTYDFMATSTDTIKDIRTKILENSILKEVGDDERRFMVATLENSILQHNKEGVALVVRTVGDNYTRISVIDNGQGFMNRFGKRIGIKRAIKWRKKLGDAFSSGYGIALTVAVGQHATLSLIKQPGEWAIIQPTKNKKTHPRIIRQGKLPTKTHGVTITGHFYKGHAVKKWRKEYIRKLQRCIKFQAGGILDFLADLLRVQSERQGYIWQGEKSKAKFEQLKQQDFTDITDSYVLSLLKKRLNVLLDDPKLMPKEKKYLRVEIDKMMNAGQKGTMNVYGFKGIVEGADDFFLSQHRIMKDRSFLYLDLDFLKYLEKQGKGLLIHEWMVHEILCAVFYSLMGDYMQAHARAIVFQQKYFPEHYSKGIFTVDENGIKWLIDNKARKTDIIFKGDLGRELRHYINQKARVSLPEADIELPVIDVETGEDELTAEILPQDDLAELIHDLRSPVTGLDGLRKRIERDYPDIVALPQVQELFAVQKFVVFLVKNWRTMDRDAIERYLEGIREKFFMAQINLVKVIETPAFKKLSEDEQKYIQKGLNPGAIKTLAKMDEILFFFGYAVERYDMRESLQNIIAAAQARYPHITITCNMDDFPAEPVHTYGSVFSTNVAELVENACKYAFNEAPYNTDAYDGKRSVTIRASLREDMLTTTVIDNGKGVAADRIDDIWVPGYTEAISEDVGFGIGLDAINRRNTYIGEKTEVQSAIDKGTRFSFSLPILRPPSKAKRALVDSLFATKPVIVFSGLMGSFRRSVAVKIAELFGFRCIDAGFEVIRVLVYLFLEDFRFGRVYSGKMLEEITPADVAQYMDAQFKGKRIDFSQGSVRLKLKPTDKEYVDIDDIHPMKGLPIRKIIHEAIDMHRDNRDFFYLVTPAREIQKASETILRVIVDETIAGGRYPGIVIYRTEPLHWSDAINMMLWDPRDSETGKDVYTQARIRRRRRPDIPYLDQKTGRVNFGPHLYPDVAIQILRTLDKTPAKVLDGTHVYEDRSVRRIIEDALQHTITHMVDESMTLETLMQTLDVEEPSLTEPRRIKTVQAQSELVREKDGLYDCEVAVAYKHPRPGLLADILEVLWHAGANLRWHGRLHEDDQRQWLLGVRLEDVKDQELILTKLQQIRDYKDPSYTILKTEPWVFKFEVLDEPGSLYRIARKLGNLKIRIPWLLTAARTDAPDRIRLTFQLDVPKDLARDKRKLEVELRLALPGLEDAKITLLRNRTLLTRVRDTFMKEINVKWDQQERHVFSHALKRIGPQYLCRIRKNRENSYMDHFLGVAAIVANEFGVRDMDALLVALFHDVLEDELMTERQLFSFGERIFNMVNLITRREPKVAGGETRYFRKMIGDTSLPLRDKTLVLLVKIADRMHSLRTLDVDNPEFQRKIFFSTLDTFVPEFLNKIKKLKLSKGYKNAVDNAIAAFMKQIQTTGRELGMLNVRGQIDRNELRAYLYPELSKSFSEAELTGYVRSYEELLGGAPGYSEKRMLDKHDIEVVVEEGIVMETAEYDLWKVLDDLMDEFKSDCLGLVIDFKEEHGILVITKDAELDDRDDGRITINVADLIAIARGDEYARERIRKLILTQSFYAESDSAKKVSQKAAQQLHDELSKTIKEVLPFEPTDPRLVTVTQKIYWMWLRRMLFPENEEVLRRRHYYVYDSLTEDDKVAWQGKWDAEFYARMALYITIIDLYAQSLKTDYEAIVKIFKDNMAVAWDIFPEPFAFIQNFNEKQRYENVLQDSIDKAIDTVLHPIDMAWIGMEAHRKDVRTQLAELVTADEENEIRIYIDNDLQQSREFLFIQRIINLERDKGINIILEHNDPASAHLILAFEGTDMEITPAQRNRTYFFTRDFKAFSAEVFLFRELLPFLLVKILQHPRPEEINLFGLVDTGWLTKHAEGFQINAEIIAQFNPAVQKEVHERLLRTAA